MVPDTLEYVVMRNTSKARAAFVANVPAVIDPAVLFRELSRADQLAALSAADAKERMVMLSYLGVGQLASLAGDAMRIGSSIYEAINAKLIAEHGKDWFAILNTPGRDLADADKPRKKLIAKAIEDIRDGIKAANGGDAQKASDAIRAIKDWGSGKRQSKSQPNRNKKMPLRDFLKSWDAFPSTYRRIMNAEDADDVDMEAADLIAAWFTNRGINPQHVLECKGRSEWTN